MAEVVAEEVVEAAGASMKIHDRVGLGWRSELAGGILSNPDRIDVIEVIAEDFYDKPARLSALKTLAKQAPVVVHGVSLGMASTTAVDRRKLEKMARVVDHVQPESWSEHLAFVRAGGMDIGHLAAPPRTTETIEGTAENLAAAQAIVGSMPQMENVATLIDPPCSDRDEPAWLAETLACTGTGLLLDLQNLYVNAVNFGLNPKEFLAKLPAERIHLVHISGGKWIRHAATAERRILDDHLHDPPGPVYDLLEELATRCPNPLTVILERDGEYPPIEHLLAQLDQARRTMERGRAKFSCASEQADSPERKAAETAKTSVEDFLARIYVDAAARARFLANPRAEAACSGLQEWQCRALERVDRVGLEMAARSFANKRARKRTTASPRSNWLRVGRSLMARFLAL